MNDQPPYRFPAGQRKAVVFSYDDGSEHDRRLVALFNRYGLRATFNLNSGRLGQPYHITPGELPILYQGHEIACHTVNHPDLTQLPEAAVRREIADDRHRLEDLSGQPVQGLAYPFGTYDDRILAMLPELGIEYARLGTATQRFDLPDNLLLWQTTGHHNQALALAQRFLALDTVEPALLYIWGHSFELDGFLSSDLSKNWDYIERVCQLLGGRADLYYGTALDLAGYFQALRRLQWSATELRNPTALPVWIHWQGRDYELKPGTSLRLTL